MADTTRNTALLGLSGPAVASDPQINAGRRAFATAQTLLAGAPTSTPVVRTVGWYDATVDPETGSFALVAAGAGLDELAGDVVQVALGGRVVFAYVLRAAGIATPVAVTRRVFCELARLTVGTIDARVAPIA